MHEADGEEEGELHDWRAGRSGPENLVEVRDARECKPIERL
jgi:hypothetical protein